MGDVVEINQHSWSPGDEDETIHYLDLTAIVAPGLVAEPREIASTEVPSRARRRVHSGDVLVSTVRPNLRGFARITRAIYNLIASTGFAVLSPRQNTISSYIYHHVMTSGFAVYLENATTGQAYPAVRPADVAAYKLSLPPLSEQRAIAAVLDSIDEAIERADEVIAASEHLRDALLHELLTRGLPGQHSEWKEAPGLGTIPASWKAVRLGDVVDVNRDSWSPGDEEKVIHYLDLTAVFAPESVAAPREIVSTEAPSRARRRVHSGDVLVSTVRPNLRGFARITSATDNLIASTGFAVLSPRQSPLGSYIYHHVMTPCLLCT